MALHGQPAMTSSGNELPAQAGLKQLCLSLRGELTRFLRARGNSDADAEDLLQDLFIRIETSTTGPIRAPRAYLYQTLNNMAHTRRRTETRRQARDADWIDARDHGYEVDKTPDAETTLADRDELARVEAHLAALPERTSFVFRQYRIEGSSQKAIAQELGISLSAVEKHLQRAYRAVLEIRRNRAIASDAMSRSEGGFDGRSD
jgi:RNA polymerase sigma-70 factor (ECF subfamily)